MELAADADARPRVPSQPTLFVRLAAYLKRVRAIGDTAAHNRSTVEDIERFLSRPYEPAKRTPALPTPPGDRNPVSRPSDDLVQSVDNGRVRPRRLLILLPNRCVERVRIWLIFGP
ncbi:MAG: hypothetical protein R2682_00795 [Pyrinomonadaceae bacterium]